MAHPARARVEARKEHYNASQEDKDRSFRALYSAFKRQVDSAGVMTDCLRSIEYESRGQKIRRKKRSAELERQARAIPAGDQFSWLLLCGRREARLHQARVERCG